MLLIAFILLTFIKLFTIDTFEALDKGVYEALGPQGIILSLKIQ